MKKLKKIPINLTKNELFYLLGCFLVYVVWALVFMHKHYGADEMGRYDVPLFIARHNALPYGWEEEIRSPFWGFSYGFSTAFPYWAAALFIKIAYHFSKASTILVFASRLTSALSMTGVGYYAIQLSKKMEMGWAGWVFIVLMTLSPEMIYIASFYNLEAFSLLTAMMIAYAWCCCLENEWNRSSCVRLAIGIALCFLSREFAYSFILGSFLLYCIWYFIHRKEACWKTFFANGFLIVGIVFAISGWVFIRNAILYDGDIFGLHMRTVYGELYAIPELKPSLHITFEKRGLSMLGMLKESDWISATARSAVSVLGYMTIHAKKWVYYGYGCIAVLGAIGLILRAAQKKMSKTELYILPALLFCGIVTTVLSIYYSWIVDYQPQGRYIITAMIFVWLAAAKGLGELLDALAAITKISRQTIVICGVALIAAFVVLTSTEAFIHCLDYLIWPQEMVKP